MCNPVKIAEQFYTLAEAANRLGVERHTVWRWIKAGRMDSQKVGGVVFIERRVVDDLIKEEERKRGVLAMGQATVRSHTRRGYQVKAHSRRTTNHCIQDVLRRGIEQINNRYQSMPVCSHVGEFLAYRETGVTFFVCQTCQRHIGYSQMRVWAKEGRVKREHIEIAEEKEDGL